MVWKECLALVEMQSHSALVQLFARVLIQRQTLPFFTFEILNLSPVTLQINSDLYRIFVLFCFVFRQIPVLIC